jgi:hypothetical protein
MRWTHPRAGGNRHNHRRAIRGAAERYCVRVGRGSGVGRAIARQTRGLINFPSTHSYRSSRTAGVCRPSLPRRSTLPGARGLCTKDWVVGDLGRGSKARLLSRRRQPQQQYCVRRPQPFLAARLAEPRRFGAFPYCHRAREGRSLAMATAGGLLRQGGGRIARAIRERQSAVMGVTPFKRPAGRVASAATLSKTYLSRDRPAESARMFPIMAAALSADDDSNSPVTADPMRIFLVGPTVEVVSVD